MNTSKFRFTLHLHSTQSQISIPVTLGDTARTWYISFADGNAPFFLGEGCLAKLEIKRPTGTHLEEFCAIENETSVRYSFSQNGNTAAVEGLHECAVILYNADGGVIGSPCFSMVVTPRVVSADDINLSDDDKTAIDAMIAAEAARAEAERMRVNGESERNTAETERINSSLAMKRAEAERQSAEELRLAAEAERQTAEAARLLSEESREQRFTQMEESLGNAVGIFPNPDEEATATLSKVKIGDTVYLIPVGSGEAVAEYDGEAVIA